MSQTTINLGFVPKNREIADWDNLPAGTKFYKDNIVQFKGSSYICSPVGYNPEHHTDSFVTVEPWTESPQVLNAGWKVFASGNNKFTTGESVDGLGIDQSPQYASSGLITSKAVAAHGSAFDISEYNKNEGTLATYTTLANALAAVPAAAKRGGMSVKFLRTITPAKYTVVKTEGLTEQPTGTELQSDPGIISGTYTAGELSVFSTLPATLNSSLIYYFAVTETVDEQEVTTYTSWVITYVQSSDNKYVQFRYMGTSTAAADFTNTANWQGVDDEPTAGSKNLVKSGGGVEENYNIKKLLPIDENVIIPVGNPQSGYYVNDTITPVSGNGIYYDPIDISDFEIISLSWDNSYTGSSRCVLITDENNTILKYYREQDYVVDEHYSNNIYTGKGKKLYISYRQEATNFNVNGYKTRQFINNNDINTIPFANTLKGGNLLIGKLLSVWQQGYYRESEYVNSSTRISIPLSDAFPISDVVLLKPSSGYKIFSNAYRNGEWISVEPWTSDYLRLKHTDLVYSISVAKIDDSPISPIEMVNDCVITMGYENHLATTEYVEEKIGEIENKTAIRPNIIPTPPYDVFRNGKRFEVEDILKKNNAESFVHKYVDSLNGNDSNDGNSPTSAYKTLYKAINVYTSGTSDTYIHIADGSIFYGNEIYQNFQIKSNLVVECDGEAKLVGGINPQSLWSIYQDNIYVSSSISGINVGILVDVSDNNLDEYGIFKPMIAKTNIADVGITENSYFIDIENNLIYVNPANDISKVVPITDVWALRFYTNPSKNIFVYFKGLNVIGKTYNEGKSRLQTFTYNVELIYDNCISQHNYAGNNFSSNSWNTTYAINCKSGYSYEDCFNYHNYYNEPLLSIVVEIDCFGEYAGWYNPNGYSENISTCHDAMNIMRLGTKGMHALGGLISDANGCHSVCVDCDVYNSYFTTQRYPIENIDNNVEVREPLSIIQNCHGYNATTPDRAFAKTEGIMYVNNMNFKDVDAEVIKVLDTDY